MPNHNEIGLNLFRQLISGGNALRDLDVFPCNDPDHDLNCECFWEQCERWADADAGYQPHGDDLTRLSDEELNKRIMEHSNQVKRLQWELARVWRWRVARGIATDEDKQLAANVRPAQKQ
jgi:hypothetical protein